MAEWLMPGPMQRRTFLSLLAAVRCRPRSLPSRIVKVRLEGKAETMAGVDQQYQVQPLHVYDDLRPKPYKDGEQRPATSTVSARPIPPASRPKDGPEGLYGPSTARCLPIIQNQLRPFLIGKDALAGETLWDQMYRSNRHAAPSHFMMAISAVDNTLWDLRGRYFNAPVYRLFGGPTRSQVEAYGSCLGFSLEPEAASAASASNSRIAGFRNQKWFMAYGPGDGPEGLRKNVELVRVAARSGGAENVQLMFDAYSGWQLDFAIAWAKQAGAYPPALDRRSLPDGQARSVCRAAQSDVDARSDRRAHLWAVGGQRIPSTPALSASCRRTRSGAAASATR